MQFDIDSNIVVVNSAIGDEESPSHLLHKYNRQGDLIWSKSLPFHPNVISINPVGLIIDSDNHIVIIGHGTSEYPGVSFFAMYFSPDGDWFLTHYNGNAHLNPDNNHSIIRDNNGYVYLNQFRTTVDGFADRMSTYKYNDEGMWLQVHFLLPEYVETTDARVGRVGNNLIVPGYYVINDVVTEFVRIYNSNNGDVTDWQTWTANSPTTSFAFDSNGNTYRGYGGTSGFSISKFDFNSNLIWTQSLPVNPCDSISQDRVNAIWVDSEFNVYATGTHCSEGYGTNEFSGQDMLTIKLDSSGNVLWTQRFNRDGNAMIDSGTHLYTEIPGALYVGGISQQSENDSDFDFVVQKYTTDGIELGGVLYDEANNNDYLSAVMAEETGSIYVLGNTQSTDNTYNCTLQKYSEVYLEVNEEAFCQSRPELYPNPADRTVFMSLPDCCDDVLQFSIYDNTGREIQSGELSRTDGQIAIKEIPDGIYHCTTTCNGKTLSSRLIIEQH